MNPRTAGRPQQPGRSLQGRNSPEGIETHYEIRSRDSQLAPEEFARLPRRPIHLVLDNLRSAFNVGSIFRLADAARAAEVVLCGYSACPPHHKLEQTSLGTDRSVPWRHFAETGEAISTLQSEGLQVVAVETAERVRPFHEHDYRFPVALVLGNEALGINPDLLARCNAVVDIPVAGFKNSLNVAVAAAVVTFELLRRGGWLAPTRPA